jgi:ferrochelatase
MSTIRVFYIWACKVKHTYVYNTSTTLIGDDKIGVLLLNLGGPETLEDVQPFLFNLFADPVIL